MKTRTLKEFLNKEYTIKEATEDYMYVVSIVSNLDKQSIAEGSEDYIIQELKYLYNAIEIMKSAKDHDVNDVINQTNIIFDAYQQYSYFVVDCVPLIQKFIDGQKELLTKVNDFSISKEELKNMEKL